MDTNTTSNQSSAAQAGEGPAQRVVEQAGKPEASACAMTYTPVWKGGVGGRPYQVSNFGCSNCGYAGQHDSHPGCKRSDAEQSSAPTPQMFPGWADAYAAFKGAFDTPLARRRLDDEFCQDARRRLREFNDAVVALGASSPLAQAAVPADADAKASAPAPVPQRLPRDEVIALISAASLNSADVDIELAERVMQAMLSEQGSAVRPERNNPVTALAIRLLVAAGACSQNDANTAFHAACSMLEEEAKLQDLTLPWVGCKLTALSKEQVGDGFCITDERESMRGMPAWQVWQLAVEWTQQQFAITAQEPSEQRQGAE